MIHYQVRCSRGHEFDGWFTNSDGFDEQVARGLVECPVCRDRRVTRALMAPALPKPSDSPPHGARASSAPDATAPKKPPKPSPGPMAVAGAGMPDQMRAFFQRMRVEIEKSCDYVGPAFAEEARRMHRGESARRAIYGEATPEQAESLSDEGISVVRVPWVERADG